MYNSSEADDIKTKDIINLDAVQGMRVENDIYS